MWCKLHFIVSSILVFLIGAKGTTNKVAAVSNIQLSSVYLYIYIHLERVNVEGRAFVLQIVQYWQSWTNVDTL